MAARVRAHDWSKTPLGPRHAWPDELRVAVDVCLDSRFPMFVWWGPDLVNIYNDAYVPMLGQRHPAAFGRPGREAWDDIWDVVGAQADAVMSRGEATWNERVKLVMERNGYPEDTYFTWSYSPIRDKGGQVRGLFCAVTEETERVRAEAAALAGEARYRALATASGAVLYQLSGDWSELQPLDGKGLVPTNDAPIKGWFERNVAAADHAVVRERIAHCIANKSPFDMEHRTNRPDGSIGWARSRAVPVLDPAGDIVDWVGTAEDVTEQRQSEEAARQARERADFLSRALEDSSLAFASGLPDGTLLVVNPAFVALTGYDEGALRSMSWATDLTPPEWRAPEAERIADLVRSGRPQRYEKEYVRKDGARVPVEVQVHVAKGTANEVLYYYAFVSDISERKRAEAYAHGILESVTDGFFSLDREWRFAYVNAAAERFLLRNRGDLVGRNIWEEFPSAIGTNFEREYRRAMAERQAVRFVEYYPAPLDAWYEARAFPSATGISVYFQDITERRRSEDALREARERLELALDAGELGTFYCPMPLGRITWNTRCKEHFFLPPDATVDIDLFYSILHPDDRDRTREAIERAVAGRTGYDVEYRTVAPDGRARWVRAKGRAYYDAAGSPVRFDGITIDISEQKRTEQALLDREAVLRTVTGEARVGLVMVDRGRRYLFANQTYAEILGLPSADVVGQRVSDVLAHVYDQIGPRLDRAFSGERVTYELHLPRHPRSDDERFYEVVYEPRVGDPANPYVVVVIVDVTQRKSAEAELARLLSAEQRARADAETASRMKDEFLATLSHELRTPLNAILGWAQILGRGGTSPDDLQQGLDVISRNARAQTQIIEDLLDMSRIVSGKIRLDVQRLDLSSVVEAAVDTVRPAADAKGVKLRAVLDPSACPVSGDPNRLQQVFWNLLTNAVKFTPRGGHVQVLLERVNSHVEVSVTDTGEGIRPDFLPHVFDRFRQADASTTRRHGGLGLGLSIVKQIAELHGGQVRAKSGGPNKGSTFVVALPLTILHATPDADGKRRHPKAPADPSRPGTEPCAKIGGVKVLVVDDEPDARGLVKRFLEDCDAVVTTAGSAQEAIERFKADRPDVLVSDVGMPGEDGYSLIRRVRALRAEAGGDVPAIALTAYARSEDRVKAVLAGFQQHVVKPVEPTELVALVSILAGRNGR